MKKIKWGVIGTAGIARSCTIPGMIQAYNCELYAIAGRSIDKAEQFKEKFGFEKAYGSYKELLDDLDKVELARLLSFSKVSYVEGTGTEVVPVKGDKCLRCWNFYNKLNDFMGQPVCPRCEAALKSFVEAHPESLNETADEQKQ